MEEFWERKGVKAAFVLIVLDIIAIGLFFYTGFSFGFANASWFLLAIAVANIDRIVFPLADLPDPPRLFTFLTGVIPAGTIIAYFAAEREASAETQQMLLIVLIISLFLWNAANITWGIVEKRKNK